MSGDTGGLEDVFLPELYQLSRGKKDVPSWIHNPAKGSVNQKGALFACRYLALGQKKEILDWLINQESTGHQSYHASEKNPANEFGSTVYTWMHEFIVVACLQRSMLTNDADVETACLRWLGFHVAAHKMVEMPNGTIISPGCRCKHLDSVSRQIFHNLLTNRHVPATFQDKWDKWSSNRGNWNCLILREILGKIKVPDVGYPKLYNPIKIARWDHGHAAYFEKLSCANSPLWYAEVDYETGTTKYVEGAVHGERDNPHLSEIPQRDYLTYGE